MHFATEQQRQTSRSKSPNFRYYFPQRKFVNHQQFILKSNNNHTKFQIPSNMGINTERKSVNPSKNETAQHFLQILNNQNKLRRQKIDKMIQQSQNKFKQSCTFKPKLNPQKTKYEMDVIERNEIWLKEKRKQRMNKTSNVIDKQLKHCTFSPLTIAKKKTEIYIKKKQKKQLDTKIQDNNQHQFQSPMRPPYKVKFSDAKKQIQKRMLTMHL